MQLSLAFTFLIFVLLILLSIGAGYGLGHFIRRRQNNEAKVSLGSLIGALLALLGFVLAITFSMVSSRYSARKQLVLAEVNAIGTTLLRTDFLPDPYRAESRKLLIDYVDNRVQGSQAETAEAFQQTIESSESLHDQLWGLAIQASDQVPDPEAYALYIESLNEVIDLHAARYYQGAIFRLPKGVWFILYFTVTMVMIAVGYEFGIQDSGNFLGSLFLALVFSALLLVISEINRARINVLFSINQQPILDLQEKLKTPNTDLK
jgi:hypothetical protein